MTGVVMVTRPTTFVIDAWPVLELYRRKQPAAQPFDDFLLGAATNNSTLLMSRINYGEIRYKARDYFSADQVHTLLQQVARYVDLVSVDDRLIEDVY